jgi:hypothetical protein
MKVTGSHRTLFIILLFLCQITMVSRGYSQETASSGVKIIQDDRVDLLVSKHIQINQNRKGIDGFRIQIFFDSGNNSKTNAVAIYTGFTTKYPDVPAYLSFKAPNYKVRIGDFRTRLDAQRMLNEIIGEYPGAWIIEDLINLPKVDQ